MQTFPHDSIETYKALARTWAATVTVVTAKRFKENVTPTTPEYDGFTATAFFTVSINPPIIVVSATTAGSAFSMLKDSLGFAVNLLAADQKEHGIQFAKPSADRTGHGELFKWHPDARGVPILDGTTGAFSCKVRGLVDAGDHTLVLGDVVEMHLGETTETLVYHNRGYGNVVKLG